VEDVMGRVTKEWTEGDRRWARLDNKTYPLPAARSRRELAREIRTQHGCLARGTYLEEADRLFRTTPAWKPVIVHVRSPRTFAVGTNAGGCVTAKVVIIR